MTDTSTSSLFQDSQLSPIVYPAPFIAKIRELVAGQTVPLSEMKFIAEKPYHSDAIDQQILAFWFGDLKLVIHAMHIRTPDKAAVQDFVSAASRFFDYVEKDPAHTLTLYHFFDVQMASMVQLRGIELVERDKKVTKSSHVAIVVKSGLIVGMVKILADLAIEHADAKHHYKLCNTLEEALEFDFKNPEELWK